MDELLRLARQGGASPGRTHKFQPLPTHRSERRPPRRAWRVLVLSHMFPSSTQPGLGPFILEQVRALRRYAKLDARVVCCQPFWVNSKNPFRYYPALRYFRNTFAWLRRWQTYEEVPVLYLPYLVGSVFPHHVHGRTYQEAVLRAAPWILRKFNFQVIHAHTSYLDGSAGLALRQQCQVPLFITEHTGPFRLLTYDERIRRQTQAAIQGADKVWCVSTALADQVREHLPAWQGNLGILPNGVDTAQFRPPERWQPDAARPKILAVMSLDENKNPLLLLRAFQRLRQRAPGATLTLAGTGPLEAEVRTAVEAQGLCPAVRLLGQCSRLEIARLMREECDILALPSNSETFGVVLIEALACGKPVVATRCGGPADIVTEPWLGRLCPPASLDGLSAALVELVRELPAVNSTRIRQHAVERFAYRNLAQALSQAYDGVLEDQAAASSAKKAAG